MVGQPSISPVVVLEVIQQLDERARSAGLVERMLSAALDREAESVTGGSVAGMGVSDEGNGEAGGDDADARLEDYGPLPWMQVRLSRAENRRAMNESELAILDYQALLRRDVSVLADDERERLYRGLVPASLDAGRFELAFDAAAALLEDPARPGRLRPAAMEDPLLQSFVDAARRQLELGRTDAARTVYTGLLRLLAGEPGRRLPAGLASQIDQLRELLTPAGEPRGAVMT